MNGMKWELKNRGTAVEIVAPLQKHGTGRMIGFKLSKYTGIREVSFAQTVAE
jgi:hypothetical protein